MLTERAMKAYKCRFLIGCVVVLGMYCIFVGTASSEVFNAEIHFNTPNIRSANVFPWEDGVQQVNERSANVFPWEDGVQQVSERRNGIEAMLGVKRRPSNIEDNLKSEKNYSEVEYFMAQQAEIQKHRKRTMTDVCTRNPQLVHGNLSPHTLRHIYVSESTQMLYCFVPKVACSNWKRVLMVIGGYGKSLSDITSQEAHFKNGMSRLSEYQPMKRQQILKSYKKFMFSRNPFIRILSAFKNKFQDPHMYKKEVYFHQFAKRIIKKYRHNPTQHDLETGEGVAWNEFAQYIADPTQYSGFDDHWEEIYRLCSPCRVNYDYIGTLETITNDAAYILKAMKVDDKVTYPARANSHPTNSTAQFDSYYGQLDRNILQRIWDIYRLDFELFGYEKPHILQAY